MNWDEKRERERRGSRGETKIVVLGDLSRKRLGRGIKVESDEDGEGRVEEQEREREREITETEKKERRNSRGKIRRNDRMIILGM